jgi:hypothetical protein
VKIVKIFIPGKLHPVIRLAEKLNYLHGFRNPQISTPCHLPILSAKRLLGALSGIVRTNRASLPFSQPKPTAKLRWVGYTQSRIKPAYRHRSAGIIGLWQGLSPCNPSPDGLVGRDKPCLIRAPSGRPARLHAPATPGLLPQSCIMSCPVPCQEYEVLLRNTKPSGLIHLTYRAQERRANTCLRAFARISNPPPSPPRGVLGTHSLYKLCENLGQLFVHLM